MNKLFVLCTVLQPQAALKTSSTVFFPTQKYYQVNNLCQEHREATSTHTHELHKKES